MKDTDKKRINLSLKKKNLPIFKVESKLGNLIIKITLFQMMMIHYFP